MSRARHKKAGGKVESLESPKDVYAGKDSNVVKEAEDEKDGGEMKKGGKVAKRKSGGKVEGEKAHRRLDRPERKRGGKVMRAMGGQCDSSGEDSFTEKSETPRRASGGRVSAGSGSDMNPLSSASRYE
jgi:hypothetical protein